jgi:hypothetical protein
MLFTRQNLSLERREDEAPEYNFSYDFQKRSHFESHHVAGRGET